MDDSMHSEESVILYLATELRFFTSIRMTKYYIMRQSLKIKINFVWQKKLF